MADNSKKRRPGIQRLKLKPGDRQEADWIGQQLRGIYQATAEEPLPAALQDLLEQLDETPAADSKDDR